MKAMYPQMTNQGIDSESNSGGSSFPQGVEFIKDVSYNPSKGILTFTYQDGSVYTVNIAFAEIIRDLDYDSSTKELVIHKKDGGEVRVAVSDLVDIYQGSSGPHIQVSIGSGNTIQAVIKPGSITADELAPGLAEYLANSGTSQVVWEAHGAFVPDYANMESTNRISINNGVWTADRPGFVRMYGYSGSSTTQAKLCINNQIMVWGSGAGSNNVASGVFRVNKGDVCSIKDAGGGVNCYFIPPMLDHSYHPCFSPDYANIETTNRISANNGTWKADRDGFVLISMNSTTSAVMEATIDGVKIYSDVNYSTGGAFSSTVLRIDRNSTIKLTAQNFKSCSCYFIPPKMATAPTLHIPPSDNKVYCLKNGEYVEMPVSSVTGGLTPDYSKMESTNRISANGGTWTVDKDGFVVVGAQGSGNNQYTFSINGKEILTPFYNSNNGSGKVASFPIQVSVGDIISFSFVGSGFLAANCYFIPPKFVVVPQEYKVGVEYDTGKIHPNGKKIYRKTYEIPAGTSSTTTLSTLVLEANFITTKMLTGLDPELSYVKLSDQNYNYPLNFLYVPSSGQHRYQAFVAANGNFEFVKQHTSSITITEGYVTALYYYK